MKIIKDAFGEVHIAKDAKWGKNTQRSLENFPIGTEKMPVNLISSIVKFKRAVAKVNGNYGVLPQEKTNAIIKACDTVLEGDLKTDFPLSVWQTGSGTQTNMNVNEVIGMLSNTHPNDDVNCGQSSNDVFPTAMHIMAYDIIIDKMMPSIALFKKELLKLQNKHMDTLKTGRTHLQDATPISFGQEVSAWVEMMDVAQDQLQDSLKYLKKLAVGATAVGTGLNTFEGFDAAVAKELNMEVSNNKFHAISSKDAFLTTHSVLNTLATNLMKMMNDIRHLASGPRAGLGELNLPANEAGSSIMPGKVNPTQAEAMMMVCAQVMGNNTVMTISNMSGNYQLNTFMPVMAYNFDQSVQLLSDGLDSFRERCLAGIEVNEEKMRENLEISLMTATYLNKKLGYDLTSTLVNKAHQENKTIRQVIVEEDIMNAKEFDAFFQYGDMIKPNKL